MTDSLPPLHIGRSPALDEEGRELAVRMIEQGTQTLVDHIAAADETAQVKELRTRVATLDAQLNGDKVTANNHLVRAIRDHIMKHLDEIDPARDVEPEHVRAYNLAIIHAMDIVDKMPDNFLLR